MTGDLSTMNYSSVNYSFFFRFEERFEHTEVLPWMQDNWRAVCSYSAAIYFLLILVGQHVMSARPRFELRSYLTAWNVFLSLFSIMGACRTLPELLHVLNTQGIYHSVCKTDFIENDRVSGFWTLAFVLSKVPELIDTVFIVLRKQPLIFLHW